MWYVLLKEGALREYAGSQGIGQLVIGSEGLNTLGWGLGAPSLDKSGRKNPSDSSASPLQEPVWSQDLDHSAEGPRSNASVCKHFIKGWCRRGHACKLYHGDPPDGSSVSTVFGKQKKEEVHKVCPHFLKGNCLRGESCGYIHAKNAVSSVDRNTLQMSEQPSQETEVRCPHFDKGWCRRGQSCGFAHISDKPDTKEAPPLPEVKRRVKRQPLAEEKKQQLRKAGLLDVCFRWAQGYCDNASCRFSHRHLQAWERRVFEELLDDNEVPPKALHSAEVSAPRVFPEHTLPLGSGSGSASSVSGVLPQPMPLPPPEPSSAWNDPGDPSTSRQLLLLKPLPADNPCKLAAPRPPASFRRGVKVESSGSTILRHKLGDCRGRNATHTFTDSSARGVHEQPCVYARPTTRSVNFWGSGQSMKTLKRLIDSGGNVRRPAAPVGLESASRFPKTSYVLNPPGTRPKPSVAITPKDVSGTIKGELIKQSVFRRAWADMSDSESSEEEPVVCDPPPVLPQGAPSSGCRALIGLSKSTYKRMRRYAFWKLRKAHGHKRPKELDPGSESSSKSQSKGLRNDSLSLLSYVNESALANNNGTGQGQSTSGDVADGGSFGQEKGEPQDNAAVSKCILRAVWSRAAIRGRGDSDLLQSALAGPWRHPDGNCLASTGSRTQRARVGARGGSLTPKPLTSNPKPVLSNDRAASLASATSERRPRHLGTAREARSLEIPCCGRASNSSPGNSLGGVSFPVFSPRCVLRVDGSSKHEHRNVSRGFNATLGYPGEGP